MITWIPAAGRKFTRIFALRRMLFGRLCLFCFAPSSFSFLPAAKYKNVLYSMFMNTLNHLPTGVGDSVLLCTNESSSISEFVGASEKRTREAKLVEKGKEIILRELTISAVQIPRETRLCHSQYNIIDCLVKFKQILNMRFIRWQIIGIQLILKLTRSLLDQPLTILIVIGY